jgi:predicted Zn-dependent peptidase
MKRYNLYWIASAVILFSACTKSKLDRSVAPKAGPAPKIQIGQYQLFTLDNGLKVIVVENHKLPRVSYSLNLDVDPVFEGQKAGYVSMAGDVMGAGTTSKSKAQIDESIDFIGANLNTSATGIFGGCLKKHSDTFLGIMSDVLLHPSFPQEEIDKVKKQTISSIQSEKTDPGSVSSKIGNMVKYGKDHPYGESASEESIGNITREDLMGYYNSYFKPTVAYLVIVGDITPAEAEAQAKKYFGSWQRGAVSKIKYTVPSLPKGNQVVFVPMPGAVQSVIDITYPLDLKPATQDAMVASVLNNVLGGSGFQTRLMQNLREDKAYTYGAYSSISPDDVTGEFSAGANVRNEVTDSAIVQFLYEMKRLVNEPVPDSTLQTVKNIMNGSFARSLERPQTIGNFAFNIEKYGLPKDYYENYLSRLNAVTSADLQAAAKKMIKPENAYITVVGNKEIEEKLKRFSANQKLEIFNPDGTAFKDMKAVPAGVTLQSVLDNYIKAVGGKEKIEKINSFESIGKMNMGPMALDMTTKMKDKSKLLLTVKMNGMEMVKQVFDGQKGVSMQMGQKQEMDEASAEDAKMQTDMLLELHYAQYGIAAELKGIDIYNGEDVYVVETKTKSGKVSTDYYSVKSGLKLRSVTVSKEGDETVTAETKYLEYGEKDGVKYPSKITQSAGPQNFEIVVNTMNFNVKVDDKDFAVE